MFTPALAGAERQSLRFECVVHSLDFALDVSNPAELITTRPNSRQCDTATLRNGGVGYRAAVRSCQLWVLLEQ